MKKLFAFLALLVCLLSAPPEAAAWWYNTNTGVQLRGTGFKYSNGSQASANGGDAAVMDADGTNHLYSITIEPTSTTISFVFWYKYDDNDTWVYANSDNCPAISTPENPVYSGAFWEQSSTGRITYNNVEVGAKYTIYLKPTIWENNDGNPTFAIVKDTPETPWDFSGNTKPSAISVYPKGGKAQFTPNPVVLTYNAGGTWTGEFTTPDNVENDYDHHVNFYLKVTDDKGNTTDYYNKDKGTGTVGNWVTSAKGQVGGGNDYYQGGMKNSTSYQITLRANTSDKTNFDWRITLAKPNDPVISPNGGGIDIDDKISISCTTDEATIYYTTDGSTPTASSTRYTDPFNIPAARTVKAIAIKDGKESGITTADFTILERKTYTVTVDFSKLTASGWTADNIHAHYYNGSTSITSWPGIEPKSVTGEVATFEFTTSRTPNKIVFNNSGSGNNRNQTEQLTLTDGKLYYLCGQSSTTAKAVAYEPMTSDYNIQLCGNNFNYILSDGTKPGSAWNGGTPGPQRMYWDEENQWFYMDIQPTSSERISAKFYAPEALGLIASGYLRPANRATLSSSVNNLTWSEEFSTDISGDLSRTDLLTSKEYTFFVRQCDHGRLQYAIAPKPGVMKTYTVKLDMSQMGARTWTNAYVYPMDSEKNGIFSWPGIQGVISNNTATFTIQTDEIPTYLMFNNGTGESMDTAAKVAKSENTDFSNNKTFKILYNAKKTPNWIFQNQAELQAKVNLPYGPSDFAEPKYFLVGARMGVWRLQPEWELLPQGNGVYKIDGGRYMFHGNFAVARVRTFSAYVNHQYELVSRTEAVVTEPTNSTKTAKVTGMQRVDFGQNEDGTTDYGFYYDWYSPVTNGTNSNADNAIAMLFACDGTGSDADRSNNDKGTWVSDITLKVNASGAEPTFDLEFYIPDPTNIDNRVFTLVGSDIENKDYAKGAYKPANITNAITTPRNPDNYDWQDAWIQYDEKGTPYYDAEGHYLYHTAYTPKVLNNSDVKFNISLSLGDGEDDFAYNAAAVTFVEASQLSDLKNDPYRELYTELGKLTAIKTGDPLTGGSKTEGTDFDFKFGTLDSKYNNSNNQWKVFVIRDAWIKGEFKLWNGWGGNSLFDEGFGTNDKNTARWNNLSGGPAETGELSIANIHGGTAQGDSGQPVAPITVNTMKNWQTGNEGKELTYYNRIILLYNVGQQDALVNSLVMFIQDNEQPVIKAFVRTNPETSEKNMTSYEWNLINVNQSAGEQATGYVVTRNYRASDGKIYSKEIENVTFATPKDVKDMTSAIRFNDPDVLNPGTYYYNIKVTVTDSEGNNPDVREANSNRFVILGDITPELSIMQLVSLTEEGYKAITKADTAFPTLQTKINEFSKNAYDANNKFYDKRFYLTYREGDKSVPHYAMYAGPNDDDNDDLNRYVEKMSEVPAQEVIDLMAEPLNYMWVSRFYVRALDLTDFRNDMENQGLQYTVPVIGLTDKAALDLTNELAGNTNLENWETQSDNIGTQSYFVKPLNSSRTREYIGAVVDRAGFLGAGDMIANMSYSYGTNSDDETKVTNRKDTKHFKPVVPEPFDLKYYYEYRTTSYDNPILAKAKAQALGQGLKIDENNFKTFLKVNAPSQVVRTTNENGEDVGVMRTVLAPESHIANERYLDCVFEFSRPNVAEAILEHYDIYYTLQCKSVVEDGATEEDIAGADIDENDFGGTYCDHSQIESYVDEDGVTHQLDARPAYKIVIQNTHPSGKIYPEFNIKSTVYQRRDNFGGEKYKLAADYSYNNLYVAGKQYPTETTLAGDFRIDINTLHLNDDKKNGKEGPRWFMTGHKDFKFNGNTTPDQGEVASDPNTGINPNDFKDTQIYMVELSNKAGQTIYSEYLWAHDDANNTIAQTYNNNTYRMERDPFFIGNLKTENNEVPKLTITPLFFFIRDIVPSTTGDSNNVHIADLVPVGDENTPANARAKVMRRAEDEQKSLFQPKEDRPVEFITSDGTNIIGATYNATDHPELVVMPTAAADFLPAADAITGIEGVAADGAGDAEAVYYNLQGIRIEKPAKGQIYIRQIGNISEKIMF